LISGGWIFQNYLGNPTLGNNWKQLQTGAGSLTICNKSKVKYMARRQAAAHKKFLATLPIFQKQDESNDFANYSIFNVWVD
jgi:hypothetical protein